VAPSDEYVNYKLLLLLMDNFSPFRSLSNIYAISSGMSCGATSVNLVVLISSFFISVVDRICRSGAIDLICIDSVSALTPRAEIEVSPPPHTFFVLI
jgi:hypothetical protein